jgi:hypothetical protein
MTDNLHELEITKLPRDRSPAFPFISLAVAIDRLTEFNIKFTRHSVLTTSIGSIWGMKDGGSQASQTLAALKYFGLVNYYGSGINRKVSISEDGQTYFKAQQDEIKKNLLKKFALNSKEISKFWELWGADRPPDNVCKDVLVLENGYNKTYAPRFLDVYDETIKFAGLSVTDKTKPTNEENITEQEEARQVQENKASIVLTAPQLLDKSFSLRASERVLQDGILSQNATYKIIVTGKIGSKEIERLIKKLEIDKEILADEENSDLWS